MSGPKSDYEFPKSDYEFPNGSMLDLKEENGNVIGCYIEIHHIGDFRPLRDVVSRVCKEPPFEYYYFILHFRPLHLERDVVYENDLLPLKDLVQVVAQAGRFPVVICNEASKQFLTNFLLTSNAVAAAFRDCGERFLFMMKDDTNTIVLDDHVEYCSFENKVYNEFADGSMVSPPQVTEFAGMKRRRL